VRLVAYLLDKPPSRSRVETEAGKGKVVLVLPVLRLRLHRRLFRASPGSLERVRGGRPVKERERHSDTCCCLAGNVRGEKKRAYKHPPVEERSKCHLLTVAHWLGCDARAGTMRNGLGSAIYT
jgi:hypothetical protein